MAESFEFSDEEREEMLRAEEEEIRLMKEQGERITKHNVEWAKKWPNHCKACGGWGGRHSSYDPSPAGVSLSPGCFWDFDPCDAIADLTVCHRCGEKGMTEDGEGPCTKCSHDFDDGLQEF